MKPESSARIAGAPMEVRRVLVRAAASLAGMSRHPSVSQNRAEHLPAVAVCRQVSRNCTDFCMRVTRYADGGKAPPVWSAISYARTARAARIPDQRERFFLR